MKPEIRRKSENNQTQAEMREELKKVLVKLCPDSQAPRSCSSFFNSWWAPSSFPIIWANQLYFFLKLIQIGIITYNQGFCLKFFCSLWQTLAVRKKWPCAKLITIERQETIRRRKERKPWTWEFVLEGRNFHPQHMWPTGNSYPWISICWKLCLKTPGAIPCQSNPVQC